MADHICEFLIPRGGRNVGGKLTGGFIGADRQPLPHPPLLMSGDHLKVSVVYPDLAEPPLKMTGIFVFSTAPNMPNQSTATPFTNASGLKAVCLKVEEVGPVLERGESVYHFPAIPYGGGSLGHYELTFVAADNKKTPPVQWSEDPEFDTGN